MNGTFYGKGADRRVEQYAVVGIADPIVHAGDGSLLHLYADSGIFEPGGMLRATDDSTLMLNGFATIESDLSVTGGASLIRVDAFFTLLKGQGNLSVTGENRLFETASLVLGFDFQIDANLSVDQEATLVSGQLLELRRGSVTLAGADTSGTVDTCTSPVTPTTRPVTW